MTGDRTGAIEAMQIANMVSPDYPLPLYNLARIYDVQDGSASMAYKYYDSYLRVAERYFESTISGENQKRYLFAMKRHKAIASQ